MVLEIIAIQRDLEQGCLRPELRQFPFDVLVDLGLTAKVRNEVVIATYLSRVGQSAPDVMLQGWHLTRRACHVDSLICLNFSTFFGRLGRKGIQEVCHGEDRMGAFKSRLKRIEVIEIGRDHIDPLCCKSLCAGAVGIACQATDFPFWVVEQRFDHGATLTTGGSDDDDKFTHRGHTLDGVLFL